MDRPHGNTARASRAEAKQRRALYLRVVERRTYADIAQSMLPCPAHAPNGDPGCSLCERLYAQPRGAHLAVKAALAREYPLPSAEEREHYVREQQASIRAVLAVAMRDATDTTDLAPEDRHRAMGRVVQLLRREADLLGLDARVRGEGDDLLDAEIRRLLTDLGVQ